MRSIYPGLKIRIPAASPRLILFQLVLIPLAGISLIAAPSYIIPAEDLEVYFDEGYVVRGQISDEVFFNSPDASQAIQFAIDKLAESGGEVSLQRGRYVLNRPLELKDRVALRGKSRGTMIIVSDDNSSGTGILCKNNKAVQVKDLSLEPAREGEGFAGIVLDNSGDCLVRNLHVQGFGSYGIQLKNNCFLCEISGCQLVDNQQANIFLENLRENGRGGDFLPNMVSDLTIYGGGNGIECRYAIVVNISDCQIFQTKGHGIYIHSTSNSVLVNGCRTFQIETDAVVVENSHEINITGNIFCWHRGHGIILDQVTWGTVSANNVIDSGVRAEDGEERNGIVMTGETRSIQVVANAIFNWGDQVPMEHGILEEEDCRLNTIAYNNINFFTGQAVLSNGEGSTVTKNQSKGPEAWIGMGREPWPDFNRDAIETFIEE